MARAAVIVIGGAPPSERVLPYLPEPRVVIAADSGLDHAYALGLDVDVVVGDLDSASCDALRRAERDGTEIRRHPPDKDATDTELALDLALERGCDHIVGVTGGGGRLDHSLAALLVFASPRLRDIAVTVHWGDQLVHVLHGPARLALPHVSASQTVSLLPFHGDAAAVTTTGLAFPLSGETLPAGTSRGVSNVGLDGPASVALIAGTLLVVGTDPSFDTTLEEHDG